MGNKTYYFDGDGFMYTGYVKTMDGRTYYFSVDKQVDEGVMAVGWKKIQDSWYYFEPDGSMLKNGTTPDGHKVDSNGVWQQ